MTAADLGPAARMALRAVQARHVYLKPRGPADRNRWGRPPDEAPNVWILDPGDGTTPRRVTAAVRGLVDRGLVDPPHKAGQPAKLTAEGRRILAKERSAVEAKASVETARVAALQQLQEVVEARTVARQAEYAADAAMTPLVVAARLADVPLPAIATALGMLQPHVSRKYRDEFAGLVVNRSAHGRPADAPALRALKGPAAAYATAVKAAASAEETVGKAVAAGREVGVSWARMGEVLGMTVSNMVVKYGPSTPRRVTKAVARR